MPFDSNAVPTHDESETDAARTIGDSRRELADALVKFQAGEISSDDLASITTRVNRETIKLRKQIAKRSKPAA